MSFGARLKEARKYMNLTQQELANRLAKMRGVAKVSPAIIAQYENGNRNPRKSTIEELGKALHLSVHYTPAGDAFFLDNVSNGMDLKSDTYSVIFNQEQLSLTEDKSFAGYADDPNFQSLIKTENELNGQEHELLRCFSQLNYLGQQEAIKRIKELTLLDHY